MRAAVSSSADPAVFGGKATTAGEEGARAKGGELGGPGEEQGLVS